MSNVCAAIGCGQFEDLDEKIRMKRDIFNRYVEGFKDVDDIEMMAEPENTMSTHWLSTMKINDGSVKPIDVIEALEANNIESRPIWKPMHLQPIFEGCDFFSHSDGKPVSEEIFETGVCLPSDTNMTADEQDRVIAVIKELFK